LVEKRTDNIIKFSNQTKYLTTRLENQINDESKLNYVLDPIKND